MQSILEKDAGANGGVLGAVSSFFDTSVGKKLGSKDTDPNYLGGSISKYAKDLIMTFPTMFDTSLSPRTAGMVGKANERNIVTMLQLLFGAMQIDARNGKEAIQKVHNNISNSGVDLLDIIQSMSEHAEGNTIHGVRTSDVLKEMTDFLKYGNSKSYPVNSLKETSLSNYMVHKDHMGRNLIREAITRKDAELKDGDDRDTVDYKNSLARRFNDDDRNSRESTKSRREEQIASLPRIMTDQDYKKANELAPTLMIITFNEYSGDDQKNLVGKTSFAAGVKARLIPVDSADIIERIAAKKNTAINFTNFIRATTGEISFVKDFLFCVQQSKILAKNTAKKGPIAKMWNVLDSRHVKNSRNAYNRQGNDASAITTLVINQETANMLKKEYNYDIENLKNAVYIMDQYNLLGLIICDESIEVAKILYHGNEYFETTPYSFLERENNDAKAYKDVINLVNRTGR